MRSEIVAHNIACFNFHFQRFNLNLYNAQDFFHFGSVRPKVGVSETGCQQPDGVWNQMFSNLAGGTEPRCGVWMESAKT